MHIMIFFNFQILEPSTYVIGGPDMFVDVGSMVNLSCVVSFTEKPPESVVWLHNEEEISFRGPRSGVSVSEIIVFKLLHFKFNFSTNFLYITI